MRLYCSILFHSFCFKLAKDTTGTLRKVVNKLHHHNASVWLKIKMLPSVIVKTHAKPLRLCPPRVTRCWGLPWVTVPILSSPSYWRTSRGFHHQFQAAACSKHLWTTSPLPQTLAVPLWSYSYASPCLSQPPETPVHACMCVPALGEVAALGAQGQLLGNLGCARIYLYMCVCFLITVIIMVSQRGKEDKAVGAIGISCECCISCTDLHIWSSMFAYMHTHIYAPRVCVCEVGNTCSTSILAAPKNMKL